MKKVLVTAGNTNSNSFKGVCYAIKEVIGDIDVIQIFDTKESAQTASESYRSQDIRELFGMVEIRSSIINDENLQSVVPERIASLIQEFGISNVYIDLSSGQKMVTSVLYSVATISRITHIYSLDWKINVTRDTDIKQHERPVEWDYIVIEPLREIHNISYTSQLELVYYRDIIERVTLSLEKQNQEFASEVRNRLMNSLADYFSASVLEEEQKAEHIEKCINGVGKICENLAFNIHRLVRECDFQAKDPGTFYTRVKQMISTWEEFRKHKQGSSLEETSSNQKECIEKVITPMFVVDLQLDVMRVYRNFASHSDRRYHFSQGDARLALDMTLLILEKFATTPTLEWLNEANIKSSLEDTKK